MLMATSKPAALAAGAPLIRCLAIYRHMPIRFTLAALMLFAVNVALVVVAEPLLEVALLPLDPAVTSTVVTPRYSRMRTSGYVAAWLNVTVIVLLPPTMFGA